jgi:hypothetical protein
MVRLWMTTVLPARSSEFAGTGAFAKVTVYLDDWRQRAHLGPVDDRWSHLVADSDDELHEFADRMGMRRAWFQDKPGRPHHAHYDLPERAREEAVALGAVEVTWRQMGRMLRERRTAAAPGAVVA